ncbi:hypothetical protein [Azospirillum ramasamyi]|uniref:Uncharacterized protein n=1 Tax=Azospirillum ramasamyi TaxID=682998 RepID=A0A2U9SEP5_9PROT|nr:hypothetical protein [Azospirillum ramasamyi]AWU98085.1 hypothetical protein DM194_27760 [Azospirillum ramasamyi]
MLAAKPAHESVKMTSRHLSKAPKDYWTLERDVKEVQLARWSFDDGEAVELTKRKHYLLIGPEARLAR